jgi:hypothetical protein
MDALFHVLARILTVLFGLGVAGCVVAIPIVAWKFFSVLLEKDESEHNGDRPPVVPESR